MAFIGYVWVFIFFMGILDLIHVRVYIGTEDKVIVSKDKLYEKTKESDPP